MPCLKLSPLTCCAPPPCYSAHLYDMVVDNARAYAPFVTVGSYLLIQDTKLTRFKKQQACGILPTTAEQDACWKDTKEMAGDSVHTFLAENKDFEMDRSLELLLYTQHAQGFLKRMR